MIICSLTLKILPIIHKNIMQRIEVNNTWKKYILIKYLKQIHLKSLFFFENTQAIEDDYLIDILYAHFSNN
jgi:hypothetical protein